MKQKLGAFLQACLGVGILAAILGRLHQRGELGDLWRTFSSALDRPAYLLMGVAITGFSLLTCAGRWQLVLIAHDFHLRFRRTFALCLVGHFFNAFMLGGTGGDLAKAFYAARDTPTRKTEIVATIYIDRLIGLAALLVLAPLMMMLRLNFFWANPQTRGMLVVALATLAAATLGLLLLFGQDLFERWPALQQLERRTRVGPLLHRAYDAFRLFLSQPGLLTRTAILSTLNHLALVACPFYFGLALGLPLNFKDYLTVFLIINLLAALPLTPAGIGTREAACLLLLGILGVPAAQAVSVSLMIYGNNLAWSMVGGIVYGFWAFRTSAASPSAKGLSSAPPG